MPWAAGIAARRSTAISNSIIWRPPARRVGIRTYRVRYAFATSPTVSRCIDHDRRGCSRNVPPGISFRNRSRHFIASVLLVGGGLHWRLRDTVQPAAMFGSREVKPKPPRVRALWPLAFPTVAAFLDPVVRSLRHLLFLLSCG